MDLAKEIRRFVFENDIVPAKEKGLKDIRVKAGDVLTRMSLRNRMPSVCNALRSKDFQDKYGIKLVQEIRKPNVEKNSSTNVFVFYLTDINDPKIKDSDSVENSDSLRERPSEIFERLARKEMGKYFGIALAKGKVPNVPKEFDMICKDATIIGDAKFFTMVKGKGIPPAKFATISEYVWLLEKTNANHRFLVFGNDIRVPLEWLKRYGYLLKSVEFFFLEQNTLRLKKLSQPKSTL